MSFCPRVLVIAEAANPEWVSVPLVGWSLARALRDVAQVHLVTQVRNRDAILRAGWTEGTDFTAIDTEAIARPAYRLSQALRMGENRGWTMVQAISSLSYPYFERQVWKRFGDRIAAGAFDIVHRVTPLSPTANSPLAPLCRRHGVPFVLGPLNGGVPWPPGFLAARLREGEWLSFVRGAFRYLPARHRTLDSAAAIIAGSRHTGAEIPARHAPRVVYIPENAVDPARFAPVATEGGTDAGPLRGCFIGRLVPYKGCDMLIEAAAPLLRAGRLRLDIVGDGPDRGVLERRVAALGVDAAVRFHGWVPHEAVARIAADNRMLLFPSIREFGGGVVLEAMAMGLVPLVCDYAGPAELVTDDTGFRVAMGGRDAVVAGVRARLEEVCARPEVLGPLSAAARTRVAEHFTWAAKAAQIARVYDWVCHGGPRPDPFSRAPPDAAASPPSGTA